MLAEDLNIAFPVTFWTTSTDEASHTRPSTLRNPPSPHGEREDTGTETIPVGPTQLIVPRNTEYEIFLINGKRHPFGAVFIIDHRSKFSTGMPPVRAIAEQAHHERFAHSAPFYVEVAGKEIRPASSKSIFSRQGWKRNCAITNRFCSSNPFRNS